MQRFITGESAVECSALNGISVTPPSRLREYYVGGWRGRKDVIILHPEDGVEYYEMAVPELTMHTRLASNS